MCRVKWMWLVGDQWVLDELLSAFKHHSPIEFNLYVLGCPSGLEEALDVLMIAGMDRLV